MDDRYVNDDVFMKDLSTNVETRITNNPTPQFCPAIYGDRIVWEDSRIGNSDIYLKELD
jgi:beta propeller repeat protein